MKKIYLAILFAIIPIDMKSEKLQNKRPIGMKEPSGCKIECEESNQDCMRKCKGGGGTFIDCQRNCAPVFFDCVNKCDPDKYLMTSSLNKVSKFISNAQTAISYLEQGMCSCTYPVDMPSNVSYNTVDENLDSAQKLISQINENNHHN
ncbi:hypothetical protein A3F66_05065 [candidate division TM6 bacterium RIFCSPHIGHO2_12_FULL_32_22]|nr:MAG: hypothetical protein A3F66_05065 [candidate division TM6 bacterium RIFCSPHIGHO2_12_FULL_32_22]